MNHEEAQANLQLVLDWIDGQIVQLRDHAHRADALADAGLDDSQWR